MLVTIDSNIPGLPQLVSQKMDAKVQMWCSKLNLCIEKLNRDVLNNNDPSIYYDTPISMSDKVSFYNLQQYEPNMINFVYIDYSVEELNTARILKNVVGLRNVVVVTNSSRAWAADKRPVGHYTIECGNCQNPEIADVLSGIFILHLEYKRVVRQEELVALLQYHAPTDGKQNKTEPEQMQVEGNNSKNLGSRLYGVLENTATQPNVHTNSMQNNASPSVSVNNKNTDSDKRESAESQKPRDNTTVDKSKRVVEEAPKKSQYELSDESFEQLVHEYMRRRQLKDKGVDFRQVPPSPYMKQQQKSSVNPQQQQGPTQQSHRPSPPSTMSRGEHKGPLIQREKTFLTSVNGTKGSVVSAMAPKTNESGAPWGIVTPEKYTIYAVLDAKRSHFGEIVDCSSCKL